MKKYIIILLAVMFISVSTSYAGSQVYGGGVHLKETTKVSTILDQPERYIGKRVKVAGIVVEVCAKRGCWIYIASDRPYEKIQVKVLDGEIVFPMSAAGHKAIVEGVVEELKLSKEEMLSYKRHLAEEKGVPFDPATVKENERLIRLVGKGAEVEE